MIAVAIGILALFCEAMNRIVIRALKRRLVFQRQGNSKLIEMNTALLRENAELLVKLERRT